MGSLRTGRHPVECLETRTHLSAAATLDNGLLNVLTRQDAANSVWIRIDAGQLVVLCNSNSSAFDVASVREIRVIGGMFNDNISLDATVTQPTLLRGGGGMDFIVGGSGNDAIYGGLGRDYLVGGRGNDIIIGNKAKDAISGGRGADTIDGSAGADNVFGDQARDVLVADSETDTVCGGAGVDHIEWTAGEGMTLFPDALDTTVVAVPTGLSRVTVTSLDAGKTIQVPLGGQLVVQLSIDPTSSAQQKVTPSDPVSLPLKSQSYVSGPVWAPGGGGTMVYIYDAVKPGQTQLSVGWFDPSIPDIVHPSFALTIQIA